MTACETSSEAGRTPRATTTDYVPLPAKVVSALQKVWAKDIKDASGKPLYALSN